jgi:hypothetical protein
MYWPDNRGLMRITLLACITCCLGAQAQAQGHSGSLPMLYVEEFQPLSQPSSGFGPIHTLASRLHARRVDENAVALSRSLVGCRR